MEDRTAGLLNGFLGVAIFSGSLPATRVAVLAFDPLFLTVARAAIAGLIGVALLALARQKRPPLRDLAAFTVVALGVVVGFPLLTALALRSITSAHATTFIGLLPLATAIFAVLRSHERPKLPFWLFSIAGSALVAGFALFQGGSGNAVGDSLMIAAILACGLGYAEGARLSRLHGGWQVISWALVLALPVMLPLAVVWAPGDWTGVDWPAVSALAYVSVFSMMVGFVFWYRGLALGGTASVGQLQLLQPFMGLVLAGLILKEAISWPMVAVAAGVVACVAGARRFAA